MKRLYRCSRLPAPVLTPVLTTVLALVLSVHSPWLAALELDEGGAVHYSQRDLGGVGLLQMPSARMNPEGELSFFLNYTWPYTRGGFVAQPADWLEVLFRYSNVANRLYGSAIAGTQDYKDKAIDVKLRLLEESYRLPQVALGFQDLGGTGLFSGEYLVASKQWRNLDFSLGVGWGYLGQRGGVENPLVHLSDTFRTRSQINDITDTGDFSLSNYFSGEEVSLFAGVEYRPQWAPITLKLELDGNDYQSEGLRNRFEQSTPLNLGLVYHLAEGVDLHAGFERGNEWMLGISVGTNFQRDRGQPKIFDPQPLPIGAVDWEGSAGRENAAGREGSTGREGAAGWDNVAGQRPEQVDWVALSRRLQERAGWKVASVQQGRQEVVIRGEQQAYLDRAKGVGRASRVLSNELDASVAWFSFVEEQRGLALNQVTVNRATFEQVADHRLPAAHTGSAVWASPVESHGTELYRQAPEPFRYEVSPGLVQSFGGPDGFLLYQLSANFSGELSLGQDHWASGLVVAGLLDNFDKFDYTAPSNLPRVRTHIREYLTTSRVRLESLQVNQLEQLGRDWFAQGYAGYLEGMYAGLGGELLYRPYGQRWALGADLNYVRKRAFDMRFGLRDYGVLTGHATAYYQLPWMEGTTAEVSVGRYLAKDLGATFRISRTFRSNVTLGAWATFTNVTSEQFGEGSFDKGFFISVPFDYFFAGSSTRKAEFNWNFLTRDGGQRLARRYRLYDLTTQRDVDGFYRGLDRMLE